MGLGLIPDTIFNLLDKKAQTKGAKQVIGQFDDYQTNAGNALGGARDAAVAGYNPFLTGGTQGFQGAQNMLAPGYQYSPSDPSYAWRFGQGVEAIDRSAAARGGLGSGGTLKALTRFGQGEASQEFGADFARRNQLAQYGLQAANGIAQAQSGYGREMSNVYLNAAKGRSTGYLGKADAKSDFWGATKASAEDAVSNIAHLFGF